MQYNSDQIAQILPHRYPFALVDRIVDGEEGKWAKGIKCVTVNEPFFQGHFPQYHVMPGVLIVEAMAQVGGVALLSMPENKGKLALFGGIKNARFRRQVTPGDVLEMTCTLTKQKGPVGIGEAKATVNGQVVATAELTFALVAGPACG
ncbi:MAG TPA: 3-hydroxyacyl-ACP dehydratase FabZ [Candidatus Faecalibacterium faecipullorum]|uniref:3-hydroxyacyl-[acyl-carrier-protein] dehydratase FabZ n=1 Tax=Candidatus Faecalibacterium faecipullorum TaxID=2838578 RepID=A0A9D2MFL6_9FIRM|nr:3-hydroxyacyl-ACP dehydratase FabZ [Candidatus Faecalibacterium faecipullorum]